MRAEYPYPSRTLSPNGRVHWALLAKAKHTAKEAAFWITREAITNARPYGPVKLAITFHPKTANLPDLDNAIASFKAYQDGIAQALGVDDSQFLPTYAIGAPVKGGRVDVEFDCAWRIPHKGQIR